MDAAKLDVNFTSADVVLSLLSPFAGAPPAWKARASGVLFVAGVGSYCAYRICTKYLGKRFVWTLLESARFDNLASADRRLLYACGGQTPSNQLICTLKSKLGSSDLRPNPRLWDLTHEKPSTSQLKVESSEMTDSGFSRSTRSKLSQEPRSLFDSAIGGEMFSSEDESVDRPERRVLNPLRESDTTSQLSLEWCDECL
ncbi:hypothetical protein TELCIR_05311, partial [Teladorsagia circumcincta]